MIQDDNTEYICIVNNFLSKIATFSSTLPLNPFPTLERVKGHNIHEEEAKMFMCVLLLTSELFSNST